MNPPPPSCGGGAVVVTCTEFPVMYWDREDSSDLNASSSEERVRSLCEIATEL